jgi:serine/threonine protein phosphatase PrpC
MEVVTAFESRRTVMVLCGVADGVGGSRKGELASKLTLQVLARRVAECMTDSVDREIDEALRLSIEDANRAVVEYGIAHPEAEGLSSTLVVSIIDGKTAYLGHVGDSRIYKVNQRQVKQLTKDHSEVQELVDAGKMTSEEARHHNGRNVITRAVGVSTEIQVETSRVPLASGDRVLLCSDGLWEPLTDREIREIVMKSEDPQSACSRLVALARERDGKDNITAVIVELHKPT